MQSHTSPSVAQRIGTAYLYYLALLPAVGTVLLFSLFGAGNSLVNFLCFVLGVATVSVYLGIMATYTPISTSVAKNLFAFVDAPIWAIIAIVLGGSVTLYDFAVHDVLIEMIGVLFGILLAIPLAPLPATEKKNAGTLVALPLIGMLIVAYFFLKIYIGFSPVATLALAGAVVQSAFTYRRLISGAQMRRDAAPIAVVGLAAWVIAFFIGLAISS